MLNTRSSVISFVADNLRISPVADMGDPGAKPRDARYHNKPKRAWL